MMKRLGVIPSDKGFLLPVIMTVSFFLVFLGMRAPALPKPHKPNGHNRAIVEVQVKEAKATKATAEKVCPAAEILRRTGIPAPATFRTVPTFCAVRIAHPPVIAGIPSRAPPVFQA